MEITVNLAGADLAVYVYDKARNLVVGDIVHCSSFYDPRKFYELVHRVMNDAKKEGLSTEAFPVFTATGGQI